jgi:hypothetical protein
MSDDDDRFTAWAATEGQAEPDPLDSGSSDSGFAPKKERRFAAAVFWRRYLFSLAGKRAVLELKDGDFGNTATLTSRRGDVLFTAPVGKVRCRRSWPYSFTMEYDGKRWRMWGVGVNGRRMALRQLDMTKGDDALTLVPKPPGLSEEQYRKVMRNKMAQQKLWRELWLIVLKAYGAKVA